MAFSQTTTAGASYTWTTATWDWSDFRATTKSWTTSYVATYTCTESDTVPVFYARSASSGNRVESGSDWALGATASTAFASSTLFDSTAFGNMVSGIVASGTGAGTSGGFIAGMNYVLFNSTAANARTLTSKSLNLTSCDVLYVEAIAGTSSNGGETPDTSSESLVVQFSNDNFATTTGSTTIIDATSGITTVLKHGVWTNFVIAIPAASKINGAKFRIAQLSSSGAGFDNYGVRRVGVRQFMENESTAIGLVDSEAFATAEAMNETWTAIRNAQEAWATAEARRFIATYNENESFATAESQTDVWAASRSFSSSWATAEARNSTIESNDSEAFTTAESLVSLRTFLRNLSETLAVAEVKNTALNSVNPEAFSWASAQSDVWNAIKTNPETLTVAETYSDIIAWIQANLESWTTSTVKNTSLNSVNTEVFSAADARAFAGSFNEPEAFAVADARRFDGVYNENDGFAVASAQADVVAFARSFASAWATAEQDASGITKRASSAFATAEALADTIGFARNFAEAFNTAEVKNTALNSVNPEAWATAEQRISAVTNVEPETFATVDARRFDMTDPKAEAVGFTSVQTDVWTATRGFASSWNTAEARVAAVGNNEARSLAFAEVRSDVAIFSRNWAEPLPIAAAEPTTIFKAFASSFAFAEARADVWSAFRNHAEALSWTESYIDNINWIQANNETLGIVDTDRFTMVKQLADAFGLSSSRAFSAIKRANNEVFAMVETYADFINFIQANSESFGLVDTRRSTIAGNIRRSLAMRDMALRNATGIYGDITIRNYAMTADTFAEFVAGRAPIGYAPFKEFLAGDYSFETALINAAVVPTSGSGSTMSIQSMTTNVDVPDINDRGTNALTAAGLTVYFARAFTVAPQVVAQQSAGAIAATPRVSNITTTSFFIQLFDAANPNVAVAGSASWAAVGY